MARNNCELGDFGVFTIPKLSLTARLFPSGVKRRVPTSLPQQHPQSPDEDAEDEHRDRDVLHRLLDSLLPARPVVLAISRENGGDGVPFADSHALHLWPL